MTCDHCHARLSKYAPPNTRLCAPCDARIPISHYDYLRGIDALNTPPREPDTCQRGHDLTIHGRLYRTDGDRYSRKCSECQRLRANARHKGITVEELLAA